MPFAATWMQLESIILSEVKTEKQIPYDIIYMGQLKYDTNEPIYKQKQICGYREQTCGCQGGGDWGKDKRVGGWGEQMEAII